MISTLLIVSLALASQVNGSQGRYPAGGTAQPAAPHTNQNTPPRSNTAPPTGSTYSPSRPPSFNTPPPNSVRPLSPAYPMRPGLTTNNSSATQPQSKSAILMQAMLTRPAASQLSGDSVRLIDVITTGQTRNEQTQRIEAYWDLCSSVADYYLSVREQEELNALIAAAGRQSEALQQARNKMQVRTDTALRAARASQFRLAGFIGRGPSNLPLPADLPHCGSYTSRYEQVFAGRSSPEAQVLAQLLPMRYAELDDAAANIASAEDWLKGVASHSEAADATGNLKALELLALQRRAFVQIARDYNRRIARYSELATPGEISPDRLTGMLIKRSGSPTATRSGTAAPPPTRTSSGVEKSRPRTFAGQEDWLPIEKSTSTNEVKQDSAVQPASATSENPKERSVLIRQQ
jgi:hypothetical protein